MSEEKVVDVEVTGSMKTCDGEVAEDAATTGQRDMARPGNSSRNPSVRLARTGAEIAGGAKSLGSAMVAAGYSEWTARVPSANGVTIHGALEAAEKAFPGSPTVASLKIKSLKTANDALDDEDTPLIQRSQLAVALLKHAQEVGGEDESAFDALSMAQYRQELCLVLLSAMQHGARLGARHPDGRVEAALQRRLDEFPSNKSFEMDRTLTRERMERYGLDTQPTFTNVTLGGALAPCGDAGHYRRARERGFPLPFAADNRPWQFQAKR